MKRLFEEYGMVALIAIVIVTLTIISSPVGGGIQNATTSMVNSFKDKVIEASIEINQQLRPGMMIQIEGRNYVILQNKGNNQFLVMDIDGIGRREFNTDRNGQDPSKCGYMNGSWRLETCNNQYENSNIDVYLNEEYYNLLSFKEAIVEQKIQQNFYQYIWSNPNYKWADSNNPLNPGNCTTGWCIKQPNGDWISWYKHTPIKGEPGAFKFAGEGSKRKDGLQANIIKRKIFLPSVNEISQIINTEDQYEMQAISRGSRGQEIYTLLRDGGFGVQDSIMYIGIGSMSFENNPCRSTHVNTRPTFVIDLSKVEFTNTGEQFIK